MLHPECVVLSSIFIAEVSFGTHIWRKTSVQFLFHKENNKSDVNHVTDRNA